LCCNSYVQVTRLATQPWQGCALPCATRPAIPAILLQFLCASYKARYSTLARLRSTLRYAPRYSRGRAEILAIARRLSRPLTNFPLIRPTPPHSAWATPRADTRS